MLKYGLAVVLMFVGLKIAWLNDLYGGKFPITISLGIIAAVITISVIASLLFPKVREAAGAACGARVSTESGRSPWKDTSFGSMMPRGAGQCLGCRDGVDMESLLGHHWHHLPAEEVLDLLDTDGLRGLDQFEVQRRQRHLVPTSSAQRRRAEPSSGHSAVSPAAGVYPDCVRSRHGGAQGPRGRRGHPGRGADQRRCRLSPGGQGGAGHRSAFAPTHHRGHCGAGGREAARLVGGARAGRPPVPAGRRQGSCRRPAHPGQGSAGG